MVVLRQYTNNLELSISQHGHQGSQELLTRCYRERVQSSVAGVKSFCNNKQVLSQEVTHVRGDF